MVMFQRENLKTVVLISCVKSKKPNAAKARDLFISPLFKSKMEFAQRYKPDEIYVLSSKYGLVELDQVVEPYDVELSKQSETEKRAWASKVLEALKKRSNLNSDKFILLASSQYRKYLIPALKHFEIPLDGLRFGKQLQRLKR